MKAILQENTVVIKNVYRQHLRNKSFSLMQEAAKKSYHLTALIIIFFEVSFAGWLWEVALHYMTSGNLVNRGTLHGPWLPIYGAASVFLLIFLRKYAKRPLVVLAGTIVSCGVIEYITSFVLEMIFHTRWWDYSDMPMNINGRICAGGLVLFGLGGCAVIYMIGPMLRKKSEQMNKKTAAVFCVAAMVIFLIDVVISFTNIRTGAGITAALLP